MNTVLWILQILLALMFLLVGAAKLFVSVEVAAKRQGWVLDFPPNIIKVIGLLEVLAALGLILPGVTNILPWLTPLAAVGLILTMIGAMTVHLRRKETIVPNIVLLVLAAAVAYGRFVVAPL